MTSSAGTFTYWSLLGLSPGCDSDELKQAFRREAKRWHPDLNKSSIAEERFKWINESYLVLSDPKKRLAWEVSGRPCFEINESSQLENTSFDCEEEKPESPQPSTSFDGAEKILMVLICSFILVLINTCFF